MLSDDGTGSHARPGACAASNAVDGTAERRRALARQQDNSVPWPICGSTAKQRPVSLISVANRIRCSVLLRGDARLSLKEIAGEVGLSSPSTSDRLRRLQERGIVRRSTVELDAASLGFPVQALVRVRPLPGKVALGQKLLEGIPEIAECDKVTGDDCLIARVFVRSIEHLDGVLDRIGGHAETSTAVVKVQAVRRRPLPFP